jgi:16S rRNA (guanine966-N2)-methyltransferase
MPRSGRSPDRRRPDRRAGGDPGQSPASPPRIIGGDLRGRRLAFVPDGPTRPMKDRVRELLFDLIGTDVRGSVALDLFAGTGALGFEAVSRGAAAVVFCERHFPTAATLRRSAAELNVTARTDVRTGDVLLWARRMPALPTAAPWLVFISPPWEMFAETHERRADLLALVAAIMAAAPAASTIVVEADVSFLPAALPEADRWETRPAPPAVLHLLRTDRRPQAGGSG